MIDCVQCDCSIRVIYCNLAILLDISLCLAPSQLLTTCETDHKLLCTCTNLGSMHACKYYGYVHVAINHSDMNRPWPIMLLSSAQKQLPIMLITTAIMPQFIYCFNIFNNCISIARLQPVVSYIMLCCSALILC